MTGLAPGILENCLERMQGLLERMPQATVAVFGDFCVDGYWTLGREESELSIETGLPVRRVR